MNPPGSQYHVEEQVLGEPLLYSKQCMGAQQHQKSVCILETCNAFPCILDLRTVGYICRWRTCTHSHRLLSLFAAFFSQPLLTLSLQDSFIQVELLWWRWYDLQDGKISTTTVLQRAINQLPVAISWKQEVCPLKDSENKGNIHGPGSNEIRFSRHCFQGYTHSYSC